MSLLTELFGPEILDADLNEVKRRIRMLPPTQTERKTYLLHDWAAITEHPMTEDDFKEVLE